MRRLIVPARPGHVAPRRVLLMPGAYQEPEEFVAAGFVDAVRARGLALDLEFIAPELAHLLDRTILDDLRNDVIAPARAEGVREIWLGGASLGAYIALGFVHRHGPLVDGLCLLAPYVGNRITTGEIAAAGGVRHWQPARIEPDDEERQVWVTLRGLARSPLRCFVGLGQGDRFGHGQALLRDALPAECIEVVEGGHDWATWRRLWDRFLARLG